MPAKSCCCCGGKVQNRGLEARYGHGPLHNYCRSLRVATSTAAVLGEISSLVVIWRFISLHCTTPRLNCNSIFGAYLAQNMWKPQTRICTAWRNVAARNEATLVQYLVLNECPLPFLLTRIIMQNLSLRVYSCIAWKYCSENFHSIKTKPTFKKRQIFINSKQEFYIICLIEWSVLK